MLQLPGAPALSAFRLAKLLARLAALEPTVRALDSRFIHFVDLERPLAPQELDILPRLLTGFGHSLPRSPAVRCGTQDRAGGRGPAAARLSLRPKAAA